MTTCETGEGWTSHTDATDAVNALQRLHDAAIARLKDGFQA